MRKWGHAAILAAVIAASGCNTLGLEELEDINLNNAVPAVDRQKRVIDGITYTKTDYADGSVEYTAHNAPPKGYTGTWSQQPGYQATVIYIGPKGTRRTVEAKGNPPLDPLDPKIWEQPQAIITPVAQPVSAPLAGPTSSTPRPRGEGGGGGGGGGGGAGGGGGH